MAAVPGVRLRLSTANPDLEWMDLRSLTHYADVSLRTLGDWIRDTVDPLPATRVNGKILVSKRKFNEYMESHAIKPSAVIDEILKELDAS